MRRSIGLFCSLKRLRRINNIVCVLGILFIFIDPTAMLFDSLRVIAFGYDFAIDDEDNDLPYREKKICIDYIHTSSYCTGISNTFITSNACANHS